MSARDRMNGLYQELDIFMELYPSMSYEDIVALPQAAYRALLQARSSRKKKEADQIKSDQDKQQKAAEQRNKYGVRNYK